MRFRTRNILTPLLGALVAVPMLACSSATPTDTPGVDRMGEYVLRQEGPEVKAVIGHRHASRSIGDEWLILELAVTSPDGQTATIERDDVYVVTPDGRRIPLATQREFGSAYPELRSTLQQAAIARDPMDYFKASRRPCELNFFTEPGQDVVFDELSLNDRRGCQGSLFFRVPGGIQEGRWVFGIDLPESEIRIPFTLGS